MPQIITERNPAMKALSHTDITGKLTPVEIDRMIATELRAENFIRENCPRKTDQRGEAYRVNTRTARPAAEAIADTAGFTDVESTFAAQRSYPYKTLGVRLVVTRKAQAEGMGLVDLMATEIEEGAQSLRQLEETLFLDGTVATPTQYDGLNIILDSEDYRTDMGANGAALTAAKLDEALDDTFDLPHNAGAALIMNYRTRREISALLSAKQRFNDQTVDVRGGWRVTAYDGIPMFATERESITRTQGTASTASNIYIVNWAECFYGVLTELQTYMLAQVTSQYMAAEVIEDLALVVRNRKRCRIVRGIIPPA